LWEIAINTHGPVWFRWEDQHCQTSADEQNAKRLSRFHHKMIFFLESETPVDICMIHLYMHVMATAYDNVLKSQFEWTANACNCFYCKQRDGTWVNSVHPASTIGLWPLVVTFKLQTADTRLVSHGYWAQLQKSSKGFRWVFSFKNSCIDCEICSPMLKHHISSKSCLSSPGYT
jgi:hypothetical protein